MSVPWFSCGIFLTAHMTGLMAMLLFRSPLSNLRKLTLGRVKVPSPTLQTVATRLRELHVHGSYLQGSADGFLTKGWTALTSLSLVEMRMENGMLTAALELPALEDVRICEYDSCESDRSELQLDQLTASCPQVSRLEFQLNNRFQEASRQSYRLLNLKQLADLRIRSWPKANVDLDLPPSLTQLRLGGYPGGGRNSVDFFWALLEAAKCAGRGAQLHRLICDCAEAYLQPAQWGASLDEQHRRLGVQLGCLRELEISGAQEQLLSAVGAVASAAPSLVSLKVTVTDSPPWVEVSPICSASLQSIRVEWGHTHRPELPAPRVLLTFLPGCTRLQEVIVHFMGQPVEGATVKIRCHCCSQRCIEPVYGYARFYNETPEEVYAGAYNDIFVKFLHRPSPEQGVHEYTVLYSCHAAEPEQRPLCFHAVLPGGL